MQRVNARVIGKNLRELRLDKGLTQKNIAERLGVSFQQVQKYETGKNNLPLENLLILKQFYNIPFENFFGIKIDARAENGVYQINTDHVLKALSSMDESPFKRKILKTIAVLISHE